MAGILAVSLPALATREVDRAFEALDAGRLADAVDAADRARRLNPLSLAPLQARALAAEAAGDRAAAAAWYEKATSLQPENPDTWYDASTFDRRATSARPTRRSTTPTRSTRVRSGGFGRRLDVARDAVNDGACER